MSVPFAPGSTYRASNAYVRLKRHVQRLEDPVRIEFKKEWKVGNPLYEWYRRRRFGLIKTMQLRKERKSPFFHEYVVFELEDNGGYFRIDRRQLPGETLPLDCIYKHGVEAFDTIEQVTSLEDETYSASDCLAKLISPTIQLELVLRAVWAIHQDKHSRVYTLQHYNCYFFAQTVFLFAARSVLPSYDQLEPELGPSSVNWLIAYPIKQAVSLRTRLQALDKEHYYNPDVEIPECNGSTLPRTLRYLFHQLSKCDQGVHALSIVHLDSCSFCLGAGAPSSKPTMIFNASGRTRSMNRSVETHPGFFAEGFLFSLRRAVVDFWRCALMEALTAHEVTKFDVLRTEYNSDVYQSKEELKQRISKALGQILIPNNSATRALWSEHVREALQQFSASLGPRMQRISACPVQEPELISVINAEMIADPKWMKDWMERLAAFLDSEYDRLERALNAEIISIWVRDPVMMFVRKSNALELTTKDTLDPEPTKTTGSARKRWRGGIPHKLYGRASISELNAYLDELIQAHGARVEQYKTWLKCTSDEVYGDIYYTREAIWNVIQSGWGRNMWGFRVDPTKFSLGRINYQDSEPDSLFTDDAIPYSLQDRPSFPYPWRRQRPTGFTGDPERLMD